MSKQPTPKQPPTPASAPAASSGGPQTLLMVGVIIVLGALGFVVGAIVSGWGTSAPVNNIAEAAPPPTPGGGQLLPSGLRLQIIRPGTGPLVQRTDIVRFRYELRKFGGAVIESNLTAPQAASMPVSGLVPGFAEGLTHMRRGGEARFWIPPYLGYGDSPPSEGIGPNDTLEFLVRLEGIGPASATAGGNASAAAPDDASNVANAATEVPRGR